MSSYSDFLASKLSKFEPKGVPDAEISVSPKLMLHQRDLVTWALRRGRAAIFADTGLGKTIMQLEWARHIANHGRVLILAPLAVAQQSVREGARFGIECRYLKEDDGVTQIAVTNYDRLHRFDPRAFVGIVLDESSILKSYDGSTRTSLIEAFSRTPYRLACTATPAPNDFTELGNHSEFLGSKTRVEMLSEYFAHDGGSTSDWRVKGHARKDFWIWVASWGAVVRKPSDLGYDDAGYDLPPLRWQEHVIPVDHRTAWANGTLLATAAATLSEQRGVRRSTIDARVSRAAGIVADGAPAVVWCELNDEGDALEKAIPESVQVSGSDSAEEKERKLVDFSEGRARVMISKPVVAGFGLNWQHCNKVVFVGASHSYEQTYQAVRRCWRYGQTRPVDVHVIRAETEAAISENYARKAKDAEEMGAEASAIILDTMRTSMGATAREWNSYEPKTKIKGSKVKALDTKASERFTIHQGDCAEVIKSIPDASVDYSVFSPPFASLYTYSASPRDMGNCTTHEQFHEHMAHLVPDLFRVTKPGRLLSFHCMLIPTSKTRDGFIGLSDFRGELIRSFVAAGWIHHSEVVIWKDPVTAMQRTKALGLLHKTIRKDSSMSRQGIPDYLITMRKPGDNAEPIAHTSGEFPVQLWQQYASPVWADINPSDTLQYRSARENDDERHICPLQLEVIRRALKLWTNPGDVVLSPFAGIGSEGVVALEEGRRFLGIELKRGYYEQATRNLAEAEHPAQRNLFALAGVHP